MLILSINPVCIFSFKILPKVSSMKPFLTKYTTFWCKKSLFTLRGRKPGVGFEIRWIEIWIPALLLTLSKMKVKLIICIMKLSILWYHCWLFGNQKPISIFLLLRLPLLVQILSGDSFISGIMDLAHNLHWSCDPVLPNEILGEVWSGLLGKIFTPEVRALFTFFLLLNLVV